MPTPDPALDAEARAALARAAKLAGDAALVPKLAALVGTAPRADCTLVGGSCVAGEAEPSLGVPGGDGGQGRTERRSSASRERAPVARKPALSSDQACSIGFRSGE
jgi:hypothetical protein